MIIAREALETVANRFSSSSEKPVRFLYICAYPPSLSTSFQEQYFGYLAFQVIEIFDALPLSKNEPTIGQAATQQWAQMRSLIAEGEYTPVSQISKIRNLDCRDIKVQGIWQSCRYLVAPHLFCEDTASVGN